MLHNRHSATGSPPGAKRKEQASEPVEGCPSYDSNDYQLHHTPRQLIRPQLAAFNLPADTNRVSNQVPAQRLTLPRARTWLKAGRVPKDKECDAVRDRRSTPNIDDLKRDEKVLADRPSIV
jgi:hypothetical protein